MVESIRIVPMATIHDNFIHRIASISIDSYPGALHPSCNDSFFEWIAVLSGGQARSADRVIRALVNRARTPMDFTRK